MLSSVNTLEHPSQLAVFVRLCQRQPKNSVPFVFLFFFFHLSCPEAVEADLVAAQLFSIYGTLFVVVEMSV